MRTRAIPIERAPTRAERLPIRRESIELLEDAPQIEAQPIDDSLLVPLPLSRRPFVCGMVFMALLMLALPLAAQVSPPAQVVIPAHVMISTDEISLADIAQIHAADVETVRALGRLHVTRAPAHGSRRPIGTAMIAGRVAQAGWTQEQVAIDAPSTIVIEREARVVDQTTLESLARDLLPEALPLAPETVLLDRLRVPRELILPPGPCEWEVRLTGARRTVGSVAFELVAVHGGEELGRATCSAQVDAVTPLLVAAANLPRGTLLTAEALAVAEGTLRGAPRGALTAPGPVIGMVTTRPLRAGAVVTDRSVQPRRLVQRGDTVRVIYESAGLRITDRAQATQDGAAGDMITVTNVESRRAIQALVTGERTVRIIR